MAIKEYTIVKQIKYSNLKFRFVDNKIVSGNQTNNPIGIIKQKKDRNA